MVILANIHKVDHLILLVGSNPLPNAVAGKLLIEPDGIITLVHSNDSFPVAQRLKGWLERENMKNTVKLKSVGESEPLSIYQGVWKCLKENDTKTIGLNYTGGTKMMSVHAYRAVEQWAKGKGITPVFSYLDARTLHMVFDPPEGSVSEQRIYVGREVKLNLKEDLLVLHGWTLKNEPGREVVLPDTVQALAQVYSNDDDLKKWKEWIEDELKTKCMDADKRKWKDVNELKSITIHLPEWGMLSKLSQYLCYELGQVESGFNFMHTAFDNNPQNFLNYLNGMWLEDYVLRVLNNLKDAVDFNETAKNIKVKEVEFEIDVIAICGYQLFVYSCSTSSNKKELKKKLFEAYVRARQLGGDEARAALVCCADNPQIIEREIERDFDFKGRVRVFGRKDLDKLDSCLKDWIRKQSGEGE